MFVLIIIQKVLGSVVINQKHGHLMVDLHQGGGGYSHNFRIRVCRKGS